MSASGRYVCVHGHFYQPPRENPWIEAIERQESASPFHDWNQRITSECYGPNAAARILDAEGRIEDLINTYSRISFNVGPTLLKWMEDEAPEVYGAILRADRLSRERFGGRGSALAQAYNHMILPLANARDRRTQVLWGMRDFEHRFERTPRGMWLPETAVDTPTLEALAEAGIEFTILAPHQAEAVRPPDGEWRELNGDEVDSRRPYRVSLPSGREVTVFFYHGPTSRAVAFERLLSDGSAFAEALLRPLEGADSEAPLAHIATDGESYGHHHRHGEMALAYALRALEDRDDVELTSYCAYLEAHPPTWEARVREDTSWSCAHGVERWRSDCGCAIDPGRGWSQQWRRPLREALDELRDALAERYEEAASGVFRDPWEARDRYVDVILDREDESLDRFFTETAGAPLRNDERTRALRLLEMQRHAMLMYTSCGWFFDDVGGIETVQVLQYAGRALHVTEEVLGSEVAGPLEGAFLARLEEARSNVPEQENGRVVYRRHVHPAKVDLRKAAAHYAVSSIFDDMGETERVYCYRYHRERAQEEEVGSATLLTGRVRVTSMITRNSEDLTYAVLHLGNHNLAGGVRPFHDEDRYRALLAELRTPFRRTDYPSVLRVLDREFEADTYSLRSLFRDAQLRIVDMLLESSVEDAEVTFTGVYERRGPLLRFLADLGVPGPRPFVVAAEYVLNTRLRRILAQDRPRIPAVEAVFEAASAMDVPLALEERAYDAQGALYRLVGQLHGEPEDVDLLRRVRQLADLFEASQLPLDRWAAQNAFWRHLQALEARGRLAATGEESGAAERAWREELTRLAETLGVAMPGGRTPANGA